ncbi:MAG: hypothetical protein NZ703_00980 [Gemmataceae bacterium]|nr:hypothetical protein [Gemmataceae bacterium]
MSHFPASGMLLPFCARLILPGTIRPPYHDLPAYVNTTHPPTNTVNAQGIFEMH